MKNSARTILLILIYSICSTGFCQKTSADSTFDKIIALPDSDNKSVEKGYIEFDEFIDEFIFYCKAWGTTFDINKKKTVKMDEKSITIALDGVIFDVDVQNKGKHPINKISIGCGAAENGYQIVYGETVRMLSTIATLEYGKPNTVAERSFILDDITRSLNRETESAIYFAKMIGEIRMHFPEYTNNYSMTYSQDIGYSFVVTLKDNKTQNVSEKIPIEIIQVSNGNEASLVAKNDGEKSVIEMVFRIRGKNKEGEFLTKNTELGLTYSPTITATVEVKPSISINASLSEVLQAVKADEVEVAVQSYVTEDGEKHVIPEQQLSWYSSNGGYVKETHNMYSYIVPGDNLIEKSKQISLGIYTDKVYPEDTSSSAGHQITSFFYDSLLKNNNYDIEIGDIIIGANGILIDDDPYALEKAKASLMDGNDLTLMIMNNNERKDVIIPANLVSE